MRKRNAISLLVALGAMLGAAYGSTITSVLTSDGSVLTVSDGRGNGTSLDNHVGTAVMQSFVAGGTVYADLTGGAGFSGTTPEQLYAQGGSNPGLPSVLTDLDLATGTLNGGSAAVYHLTGLPIDADTTFFLFSNGGTPVNNIILKDAGGAAISTAYNGTDFGGDDELELGDINHSRSSNGNNLDNRLFQGFVFSVSDFTFDTGKSAADIDGFSVNSGTTDISDFGIAAVPEPATLGLVGLAGVGLIVARRFRM